MVPRTLYGLKKSLLVPRTAWRRRREPVAEPFARHMLELHYYRTPMYDFMRATLERPDILHDVPVDASSVVLDVGAYVGEWSEQIVERYGSRVYAFEPNPRAFATMRERLGSRSEVRLFDHGLGAEDAEVPLSLDGPGSSTFGGPATFGAVDVRLRDVVGMLEELGLEHVDLVKVNIEGGEYDLFDRLAGAGWLPRIDHVSVQFHEWHPHAYRRRRAIRRELRRTHDEVWCYPWVWELWARRKE